MTYLFLLGGFGGGLSLAIGINPALHVLIAEVAPHRRIEGIVEAEEAGRIPIGEGTGQAHHATTGGSESLAVEVQRGAVRTFMDLVSNEGMEDVFVAIEQIITQRIAP